MRLITLAIASLLTAAALPRHAAAQSDSERGMERELQQLRANAEGFAAQLRPAGSYLGVKLVDVDADRARTLKLSEERGVEVGAVEEGSPAENAGIRRGDVLLSYNGENVLGVQQFIRLVQETPQGRRVKITLWRDGKTQAVVVTTGAPKSPYELPPNFVGFSFPDTSIFNVSDVPSPVLVWKNLLLGLECEPVDSQLAQYFGVKRGLLVRAVEKGSAAEKAGVRAGDVLVAIGDHAVTSPHDMSSYLRSEHQPGKPMSLSLMREHKPITVSVVASDRQY
jgi:serine protease Do